MKIIHLARLALLVLMFCALAQFGLLSPKAFSDTTATFAAKVEKQPQAPNKALAHAAGRGNPWINLLDGQAVPTAYTGAEYARQQIEQSQAKPVALAADDFDEDGVPDLVCGYAGAGGGILTLHRGNVDAIYPNAPEAKQRKAAGTFTDSPFLSAAFVFEVPEAVDFLATGDFDNDGHRDILTAARGSSALYLLSGDGHGNFAPAKVKPLPGAVTALVSGEINRRDGLVDFVVGITGAQGPQVLVFESPEGAWRGAHEVFPAPAEVIALALGQLDDDFARDLAIAADHELMIVHGRDRRLSLDESQRAEVPPAIIHQQSFPFSITAITIGAFTGNQKTDLAILCADGKARILNRTGTVIRQNGRAFSGQAAGKRLNHQSRAERWQVASQLALPASWRANDAASLIRARVSGQPDDDLVVIDQSNRQLHILVDEPTTAALSNRAHASQGFRLAASLDIEGEPVAALPMRLNADALSDLVVLRGSPNGLAVALTAPMAVFTVNSTGDGADCDPTDGICSTGTIDPQTGRCVLTGQCTLRAAIQQANASPGTDAIVFSVSAIAPASALPLITESIVLDGMTSPTGRVQLSGAGLNITGGNCNVRGFAISHAIYGIILQTNGNNIVEGNYIGTDISGTTVLGNAFDGVRISSASNIIGGTSGEARNIISGNNNNGILINNGSGAMGNIVQGNYLGTDVTGTVALGNTLDGVYINASNNMVGGATAASRNIISGNAQGGAGIVSSSNNIVQGNYIGSDVTGTLDLGNGNDGVRMTNASNNTIGGSSAEARNIISGNGSAGVANSGAGVAMDFIATTGNVVQGNYIGTGANGIASLGNKHYGVLIINSAANNLVSENTIAFNPAGVTILSGTRNSIRFNSIFSNRSLGIDLGGNGVTVNDAGDADAGANDLQNFPVFTALSSADGSTTIRGTLNSKANSPFTLDFYANSACDPSGLGEGEAFISSSTVATDASGNATFSLTLPGALNPGQVVTATATDAAGNTSEFSQCKVVTTGPQTFRLTVQLDGNGTVNSTAGGLSCPGDCLEDYISGTPVTLIHVVSGDEKFLRWIGDCSGSGPCGLTMTADHSVIAVFDPLLKVNVQGKGQVMSEPNGIDCGVLNSGNADKCKHIFPRDKPVILHERPLGNSLFLSWLGDCAEFKGAPDCKVAMNKNSDVAALFVDVNFENNTRLRDLLEGESILLQMKLQTSTVPTGFNLQESQSRRGSYLPSLLAEEIANIKIELSRDGGKTFETLFASTPNDGSECWQVTGPPSDQAVIRVSSTDNPLISGLTEPFRIFKASGAGAAMPINIGPVNCGGLSTSDHRSQIKGSSFYADTYSFSGSAGQQVAITLASSAFDTYVSLIGPNGTAIAQDDNGGGGTTARVPAGSGFFNLPAAGAYTIEVTSATANATGDYLLNVSAPAPTLTSLQLLYKNKPVDHLVTGNKAKKYQLTLNGGGFTADSKVLINGAQAETSVTSSTLLTVKLPFKRVPAPGVINIQVLNPDGQLIGTLTVEIRSD
ncbi:MAG: hypothetical protein V7641_1757 [Blastocatellia bacterium]